MISSFTEWRSAGWFPEPMCIGVIHSPPEIRKREVMKRMRFHRRGRSRCNLLPSRALAHVHNRRLLLRLLLLRRRRIRAMDRRSKRYGLTEHLIETLMKEQKERERELKNKCEEREREKQNMKSGSYVTANSPHQSANKKGKERN